MNPCWGTTTEPPSSLSPGGHWFPHGILAHYSIANCSRMSKLYCVVSKHLEVWVWLCAGHTRTLVLVSFGNCWNNFKNCFGFLSCCKTQQSWLDIFLHIIPQNIVIIFCFHDVMHPNKDYTAHWSLTGCVSIQGLHPSKHAYKSQF